MADVVDSAPEFKARALKAGLKIDDVDRMIKGGIETFADLAFASTWVPGTANDSDFIERVAKMVFERADHPHIPKLRRLAFESCGLAAGDARHRLDRT
eukprot:5242358-Amphidinium_carterae.1